MEKINSKLVTLIARGQHACVLEILKTVRGIDKDARMARLWLGKLVESHKGSNLNMAIDYLVWRKGTHHKQAIDSASQGRARTIEEMFPGWVWERLQDACSRTADQSAIKKLQDVAPKMVDNIKAITHILVKTRNWQRIAQLMPESGSVGTMVWREIILHAMQPARRAPKKTITEWTVGDEGMEVDWRGLMEVLNMFANMGKIDAECLEALEEILEKVWAPKSFLSFISNLRIKKKSIMLEDE